MRFVRARACIVRAGLACLVAMSVGAAPRAASAGTPGVNGAASITAANTVVNLYDTLVGGSSTTVIVSNIANLQNAALGPVGPGSVLMLYQPQGATIDSADVTTNAWGSVTSYGNAGNYEFFTVGSVSGNTLTLAAACGNLKHTYSAGTEVVRVPQYATLTVAAGASIVPQPWNGTTGGVVAIDVAGATTINGTIDASGAGFRGATAYSNNGSSYGKGVTVYATGPAGANQVTAQGAEKGEGIAGTATTYDSLGGRYGRGAPANGGGGGDGHNAGGGGGSNGNNGNTWTGGGIFDPNYLTYEATDSDYTVTNTNAGGGRGGLTYNGDGSRSVGGRGGRPMDYSGGAGAKLFFGGGGGAGDANNNGGGGGGNGGGMIFLNVAGAIGGPGSLLANGLVGGASSDQDAAGGGGGGGTIVVVAGSGSVPSTANGGAGGNQAAGTNSGAQADGTGGGGGGGFIATAGSATLAGGTHGVTNSTITYDGVPINPNGYQPYGATSGATGGTGAPPTAANLAFCYTPIIGAAKSVGTPTYNASDATYSVPYTVYLQNYGDSALGTVTATDSLATTFPSPASYTVQTAPAIAAVSSGSSATASTTFDGNANTGLLSAGTLAVGGTTSVTFTARVHATGTGSTPYNNQATASAKGTTGNANNVATSDLSTNGTNPDPSGYGMPTLSNVVTPVTLAPPAPQLLLVKRVTSRNGMAIGGFVANGAGNGQGVDTNALWPNAPQTTNPYLVGEITGPILPRDVYEYTIYFLSAGADASRNSTVCDFVPANVVFAPSQYGAGKGIELSIGGAAPTALTNAADGDAGTYYAPGTAAPASCGAGYATNATGAVVVTLANVPNATSSGTPTTSYGFVRFAVTVP